MTGTATAAEATAAEAFRHEAYLYRGEDEFLDGVLAFVREGLHAGETVVIAEPAARLAVLRDALAGEDDVRFLEMEVIGSNPARILEAWADALAESLAAGRTLRGVGEPAWHGRRAQEFEECHLHELLLNRAFDGGPAWRLLCPYDVRRLPATVRERALHSHREWSTSAGREPTGSAIDEALAEAFAAPLPAPAGAALRGGFGAGDVPAVRRTVASWARSCGLPAERVEALELAASELATNALVHGGGSGTVALWEEPAAVVLEVVCPGRLADPMVGRLRPDPLQEGGAGLYLLNRMCDLVQLRSGAGGTTVRVTTWR